MSGSSDAEHKINAGLNLNWNGLSVGTMFALPVNNIKNPSVSFSFGYKPSEQKITRIEQKSNELSAAAGKVGLNSRENFL